MVRWWREWCKDQLTQWCSTAAEGHVRVGTISPSASVQACRGCEMQAYAIVPVPVVPVSTTTRLPRLESVAGGRHSCRSAGLQGLRAECVLQYPRGLEGRVVERVVGMPGLATNVVPRKDNAFTNTTA